MARKIVIYNDEGVGVFGLECLRRHFAADDVRLADADGVVKGEVLNGCDLFVMPGGADLPYCAKLNGAGNRNIRNFVERGGTYLGICAGAYYGCRAIEYHKGRPDQICAPRELALAGAVAYGSLPELAPSYDLTLRSAGIADLILQDGSRAQAFYHGGCAFHLDHDSAVAVLARYAGVPGHPPAVIRSEVGGGAVILSGVHFETTPALLKTHPCDDEAGRRNLAALIGAFGGRRFDLEIEMPVPLAPGIEGSVAERT